MNQARNKPVSLKGAKQDLGAVSQQWNQNPLSGRVSQKLPSKFE